MNSDRFQELLEKSMVQAQENLSVFLDANRIHPDALTTAMATFINALFELPPEAVCERGCEYCCHLRVGISIPEAIVLYNALKTQASDEDLDIIRQRVFQTANKGPVTSEKFWRNSGTACPFLDTQGDSQCLIYDLRPFSCRAYHSTDVAICKTGFEKAEEIKVPCFPLYRASTDMYSTVFIQVLAQKGLHSYQVELVRAMQILFEDDMAMDGWFQGKNIFKAAKIS